MDFIIENWVTIIAIICIACSAAFLFYKFSTSTREEQIKAVKEWLLWAVTEAEKEFGSGTGKLKLRSVYDMFVNTFPWLAEFITFEMFSEMVDEALVEMNNLLGSNNAIRKYVEGTDI